MLRGINIHFACDVKINTESVKIYISQSQLMNTNLTLRGADPCYQLTNITNPLRPDSLRQTVTEKNPISNHSLMQTLVEQRPSDDLARMDTTTCFVPERGGLA